MYYFYVLKSEKDRKFYRGFTDNLRRRFKEHQNGSSKSTKYRHPLKLVYYRAYASKEDDRRREIQMKKNAKAWGQLKRRIKKSIQET